MTLQERPSHPRPVIKRRIEFIVETEDVLIVRRVRPGAAPPAAKGRLRALLRQLVEGLL